MCHCGFGGCPSLISNSASAHSLPLALIALISRRRSRTCAKRRRPRQRRLRSLPGQSRRQRRRHARHHCGPQGQPLAPLQPLRREARLDQAAWHTARRRACQTIARNARRRADQRARQQPSGRNLLTTAAPKALAGIRQPERIYNKLGAGGFPLAPWPKPASDWRERAGRKAPTPAHKRAMTKTATRREGDGAQSIFARAGTKRRVARSWPCVALTRHSGTGHLARLMQLFDEFAHGWAGFG